MSHKWQKDIPNATTDDTISLVNETIFDYAKSPFVVALTNKLLQKSGNDKLRFIRVLFDYCCHLPYERDPEGWERVFTPELTVKVGKADCKKFTVLIGACLACAGIPGFSRVVSYANNVREHIYPIAIVDGKQYVLDVVNHKQFNVEPVHEYQYTYTFDNVLHKTKKMQLSQMGNVPSLNLTSTVAGLHNASNGILDDLSGIGGGGIGCPHNLSTIGAIDEFEEYLGRRSKRKTQQEKDRRKQKRKEIFEAGKKGGFAVPRGAFLLLVEAGQLLEKTPLKIHLAAKLALAWQKNPHAVENMWSKFGGNPNTLKKAIIKGSGVQLNGIGVITVAAVAAAIAAATPLVIATKKLLIDADIIKNGSPEHDAMDETTEQHEQETPPGRTHPPLPTAVAQVIKDKVDKENFNPATNSGGGGNTEQGNLFLESTTMGVFVKSFILVFAFIHEHPTTIICPVILAGVHFLFTSKKFTTHVRL